MVAKSGMSTGFRGGILGGLEFGLMCFVVDVSGREIQWSCEAAIVIGWAHLGCEIVMVVLH